MPSSNLSNEKRMKLRPRKRCSLQGCNIIESCSEAGQGKKRTITRKSKSSPGTSTSSKKSRSAKKTKMEHGKGAVEESPLKAAEQILNENFKANPYGFAALVARAATKLADDFVKPEIARKEVDLEEIEKLKSSNGSLLVTNEEALKEIEDLKDLLTDAKVEIEEVRQQHEEKLKEMDRMLDEQKKMLEEKIKVLDEQKRMLMDKDEKLEGLEKEIAKMKNDHLDTLKKIVGRKNFKATDDAAALKQIALQRSRKLNALSDLMNAQPNNEVKMEINSPEVVE